MSSPEVNVVSKTSFLQEEPAALNESTWAGQGYNHSSVIPSADKTWQEIGMFLFSDGGRWPEGDRRPLNAVRVLLVRHKASAG